MTSSSFAHPVAPELLAAARAGDRAAGEHIYRLFERPVYNLAWRMCQNQDEAYDVMQETFIQVLTKLDQFRGDSPFWGWLRTVAVNTALGHLRKRKRPLSLVPDEILDSHSAPPDQPAERSDLNAALATLNPETRTVVWLYDVEGYTHNEIAALFGKSVSFSKSRLSRAHQQLREWLSRDPTPEPKQCPEIFQAN